MNLVVLTHSQVQLSLTERFPWPVQSFCAPGESTGNKEANFYVTGKSEGHIALDSSKKK